MLYSIMCLRSSYVFNKHGRKIFILYVKSTLKCKVEIYYFHFQNLSGLFYNNGIWFAKIFSPSCLLVSFALKGKK